MINFPFSRLEICGPVDGKFRLLDPRDGGIFATADTRGEAEWLAVKFAAFVEMIDGGSLPGRGRPLKAAE